MAARVHDAWLRAGFGLGQTLLDVGCGPGYAALDLAEIVGPRGRVLPRSPEHEEFVRASGRRAC